MQASLIIAAYNQARNLELIFKTVGQQSCRDFEVVIADDGSSDHITDVIEAFRLEQPEIPLVLVSQEDRGFRKTVILNKAIRTAKSDYLIFIDGDMLLEEHFIELHLRYRKAGHVLCGHRGIKLSGSYSERLIRQECLFSFDFTRLLIQKIKGNVCRPARGLIIRSPFLRKLTIPYRDNLSGCNFSLFREALEKVNGFNEEILEHGYNDFELGCRLKRAGYKLVNVSKLCNTSHLGHPKRNSSEEVIKEKIRKTAESNEVRCIKGLTAR
jgi:glycosyltransferase involved in cell wall biosynthesis